MLEKKGVSPVQCQTATSGGGGGTASGGATVHSSQTPVADNSNGLEPSVLSQNRSNSSNGTNLNSASINNTSSGPNTPNEKMGAMAVTQDFVIIKSEDQKPVPANHCDSKNKINCEANAIQTQLRNNNTNDSKLNVNTTTNANMCGTRVAIGSNNINSNNNIKCRDSMHQSCAPNGPLNGPLNGIRNTNTSPLDILNDDKLSSFSSELGMPVPAGNHTMPGDLPPLPLMSQSMNNMVGPRGPCGPNQAQGPQMGHMNASPNHMGVSPHPHNNLHHLVGTNMSSQKSSVTMDSQYMQQQSQIFVFNTQMANRAAEAVDKGQFTSIVEFHCSHPETKRLLEKFPLKPQLNRTTSSAAWLNNMAQLKQGGRGGMKANMTNNTPMHPSMLNNSFGQPRGSLPVSCVGSCNMHNQSGLPTGPGPGGGVPNNWPNNANMCSNPNSSPNWSAQQVFAQNSEMNSNQKFSNSPMGPNARACAPFGVNNFQTNSQLFNNSGIGVSSQLTGTEIPDENLTPQQRQHREKQLAILRKMQQQLCPELMESSPMGQMVRMSTPNQGMNAPEYMMDRNNMCSNNMCSLPESEQLANSDTQMNNIMSANNNNNTTQYSQSHSSMPPTSGATALEWQKANYMEDRRRKPQTGGQGVHSNNNNNMCSVSNSVPISHPSPHSQPSSAINSPSPCISQSPGSRIPPPPYNQGIRPHSSPHPASPAAGSLQMPSPRMQSPADASRQQFTPGGQSRMPHSSPGPLTPSADSNSSISGAGVHSPKPMPPSSSSQNSLPSSTSSSTVVQNSCRTQTSTNVTNMRATTPSSIAPSSSPSNVKKLPNLMPSKGMSQDCGEILNPLSNSGLDSNRKLHSNDMPLLGPNVPTNCSSPFICNKPEPALMPVPSPQQIQYLNAFEGQELTIQKQPNTSLRDADLISPAPDLDLGFGSEFGNSCHPFPPNERLPNFAIMENMNHRFASNPQNANMSGHQFDMNQRFMSPDNNNQRFVGPLFDGPTPRMPNSHENQFRPQNMLCMPYGQMDNNMMPFNSTCDNMMAPRLRGPVDMVSTRFAQHMNDNMQSPQHFNSSTMSPISSEQMNLMTFGANQSSGAGCMSAVNNFSPQMESGVSSTHLQNLQKMTPPFEIGPPSKVDQMMLSNGGLSHSHNSHSSNNQVMHGSNGPMVSVSQSQRTNTFDPISSMAAMGEPNASNPMNAPNLMSGPSMNMSGMQVAANGPPPGPPNSVNFHTSMSSMQGIHQNISPDGNGMQGQYGMGQMNPNMTGGPQTVNNTYVNATMSIQQLNIQNAPNFNPNLDQNMSNQNINIGPQSMSGNGPGMSPPSGAMQMMPSNSSTKLGSGFGHRMSGPTNGPNFGAQQMNSTRGMSPMNYPPNPHLMQRSYNSPNIQIKPDAPNTIQYLPPRQQNPNMSSRPPSLDFLQRFEAPLTNLGNKLPTHNLQYFPNNNTNINSSQSMPLGSRMMTQNMPMTSGPGRPSMVRASNANPGIGSGQQPMMPSGDMFGRPNGPNNMMNGPHMGPNGPNPMFAGMKQSGVGPMSPVGVGLPPDAAQPLPPSVGHSYNYKPTAPFVQMTTSDPNYAIQFQHFQQQLYATNTTRTANTNTATTNPRMASNNFYNSSK